MTVWVYQTDNRVTLDYLQQTRKVNKLYCKELGYRYLFEPLLVHKNRHPALCKIFMTLQLLQKLGSGILIFLDSDAWIQNPNMLRKLIDDLPPHKLGYFSRDPYLTKNTFINSGSFILRINKKTKEMYSLLQKQVDKNLKPGIFEDQHYIADYVYKHRKKFIIFEPDMINTPVGKILRHNYGHAPHRFNSCRYNPMYHKHSKSHMFSVSKFIDNKPYPNQQESGYEYFESKKEWLEQQNNKKIETFMNWFPSHSKMTRNQWPISVIIFLLISSCLGIIFFYSYQRFFKKN